MEQDLLLEQREIELESIAEGVLRYNDQVAWKETSQTVPGARLMDRCMKRVVPAFEQLQLSAARKERLSGINKWGYPVLSISPQHLAVIALTTMVNMSGETTTKVAFAIGDGVMLERYRETLKKEAPDVFAKLVRFNKDGLTKEKIRLARRKISNLDIRWPRDVLLHTGVILMETVLKVCPEFERSSSLKHGVRINLSLESLRLLEKSHEEMSLFCPVKRPMIVEPIPWTGMYTGGYLLNTERETASMQLVKDHDSGDRDVATLGRSLDAVNHLQKTRWAINEVVLDALDAVYEAGGGIAGVILKDMEPLPPKPDDFLTNPEAKRLWKFDAWKMYQEDKTRRGRRCLTLKTRSLARKYLKRKAMWFVWTLDFRGRMYPAGNLSPHSDDIGRGLLRFAEPLPLGPRGFYWLSIHLANCYGGPLKLDKAPLKERYEWCQKNKEEIRRWANDPLKYKGWTDADEPFKCLAAAVEWAQASRMADPSSYLSHLYISMDGTCNGLQWLSAIGRDPIGGRATNLVPTERPNDIYTLVAKEVDKIIEADLAEWRLGGSPSPEIMLQVLRENRSTKAKNRTEYIMEIVPKYRRWLGAYNWQGKVDRKVCKRGTMTSPLGYSGR